MRFGFAFRVVGASGLALPPPVADGVKGCPRRSFLPPAGSLDPAPSGGGGKEGFGQSQNKLVNLFGSERVNPIKSTTQQGMANDSTLFGRELVRAGAGRSRLGKPGSEATLSARPGVDRPVARSPHNPQPSPSLGAAGAASAKGLAAPSSPHPRNEGKRLKRKAQLAAAVLRTVSSMSLTNFCLPRGSLLTCSIWRCSFGVGPGLPLLDG